MRVFSALSHGRARLSRPPWAHARTVPTCSNTRATRVVHPPGILRRWGGGRFAHRPPHTPVALPPAPPQYAPLPAGAGQGMRASWPGAGGQGSMHDGGKDTGESLWLQTQRRFSTEQRLSIETGVHDRQQCHLATPAAPALPNPVGTDREKKNDGGANASRPPGSGRAGSPDTGRRRWCRGTPYSRARPSPGYARRCHRRAPAPAPRSHRWPAGC